MEPINFPESNLKLIKPQGMTDEDCGSLHVFNQEDQYISCWKPDFWDRLSILFTGKIWLWVWGGNTSPPVCVTAINPFKPWKGKLGIGK